MKRSVTEIGVLGGSADPLQCPVMSTSLTDIAGSRIGPLAVDAVVPVRIRSQNSAVPA